MPTKTVDEWCDSHNFSRGFFYILQKRGQAPRSFKVGSRRLISDQADAEWIQARESEAATTAPKP